MKKTFTLTHPKIKTPRLFEAVKHDIRKYMKRERRKELPAGADYWDFSCKFGQTEEAAETVHPAALDKCIAEAEAQQLPSCYIEILSKPGYRQKRTEEPA